MNARFISLTVLLLVLSMASLAATPTATNAKQVAGIAEQHCTVRIESVPLPGLRLFRQLIHMDNQQL